MVLLMWEANAAQHHPLLGQINQPPSTCLADTITVDIFITDGGSLAEFNALLTSLSLVPVLLEPLADGIRGM